MFTQETCSQGVARAAVLAYVRLMTGSAEETDILIIGGGISGLSTAYALLARRPGLRIVIAEAGPRAGEGASWANGSMVHPSQATPWAESLCENADDVARQTYRLAARSGDLLRENMDVFGIKARHRKTGCVKLYQSRAAMDADMEKLLVLTGESLRIDVLNAAQMRARFPISGSGLPIAGGAYFPDDHVGPPRLYCAALLEKLLDAGVDIRANSQAVAIEAGRAELETGEIIHAGAVVLCAGAGNAAFKDLLTITPVRGYLRTFDLPADILPDVAIMDDTAHMSVTPLGDHLRVSGGADMSDDTGVYNRLEAYARALLPHISERIETASKSDWTAQRPMSLCGPVIDRIAPGIFANTGHGHMGWTLSAGAAEKIAGIILAR